MNAFNHLDTLFERTRHGMTDAEAREMLRTMLTLHRRPPLGIKPYQAARTRRVLIRSNRGISDRL